VKKFIALLFVVALLCSTTVGCGKSDTKSTAGSGSATPAATPASPK
jgi:hypothetical protein